MFEGITDSKRIQAHWDRISMKYRNDDIEMRLSLLQVVLLDELIGALGTPSSSAVKSPYTTPNLTVK